MRKLYPLKLRPILKEKVWGGDALVKRFNKQIPLDEEGKSLLDACHIGETWEVSGMDGDLSEVAEGFLAENDLADILETYLGDLVGDEVFDWWNLQFPLLVKMLNVEDRLSVQVHPNDEMASELFDSYGKTEFWYVMEAGPDARVYMGFKEDTDATQLYNACKAGTAQDLMNVYVPKKGDCFFIKAGTVHAAGGGLVIAEVQESSDITFRLYDWGRENDPKTRREMHLEEAIDCIDYKKYDEKVCHFTRPAGIGNLVECPQFIINSVTLDGSWQVKPEHYKSFIIYVCTEGAARLDYGGDSWEVDAGECILVPAAIDEFVLTPLAEGTHLLESFVRAPKPDEDDEYVK